MDRPPDENQMETCDLHAPPAGSRFCRGVLITIHLPYAARSQDMMAFYTGREGAQSVPQVPIYATGLPIQMPPGAMPATMMGQAGVPSHGGRPHLPGIYSYGPPPQGGGPNQAVGYMVAGAGLPMVPNMPAGYRPGPPAAYPQMPAAGGDPYLLAPPPGLLAGDPFNAPTTIDEARAVVADQRNAGLNESLDRAAPPVARANAGQTPHGQDDGSLRRTHTTIKLSNPKNETVFNTIDITAAIKKVATTLARRAGKPPPMFDHLMVTMGGAGRGPHFPVVRNDVAEMLTAEGAIDIERIDADDDNEEPVTFAVTSDEITIMPRETDEEREERISRAMEERAEKKARTVAMVTELDRRMGCASEEERMELRQSVGRYVESVVGALGEVTTVEQRDAVSETLTNKFTTYITLTSLLAKEVIDWHKLKYIPTPGHREFPTEVVADEEIA